MYLASKNNVAKSDWQPSASLAALRQRAQLLKEIRQFFEQRNVLEVDVPLLSQSAVTAVHLESFEIEGRFLQTSPEYAMKRLLAAGSGAIYYLGKAFRKNEVGTKHNPEFTMLEWYRPNWLLSALMEEISSLLQQIFKCDTICQVTYRSLFEQRFALQPHTATIQQLQEIARANQWLFSDEQHLDKAGWLDLLFSHGIEPYLGLKNPILVTEFPAEQAGLATIKTLTIKQQTYSVAERFEVFFKGFELANGYQELTCANEQAKRFEEDNQKRLESGLPRRPIDHKLLAALQHGLPICTGVAVGFDRLLMLQKGYTQIKETLPFHWENA